MSTLLVPDKSKTRQVSGSLHCVPRIPELNRYSIVQKLCKSEQTQQHFLLPCSKWNTCRQTPLLCAMVYLQYRGTPHGNLDLD